MQGERIHMPVFLMFVSLYSESLSERHGHIHISWKGKTTPQRQGITDALTLARRTSHDQKPGQREHESEREKV